MTLRLRTANILAVVVALAGGAIANRAALHAPLEMDDVAQRAMIEGKLTPRRGPFNLYDFVADDNRAALLDRGVIPWWSEPKLVTRFLRPVPSALVWLDYQLFGYGALGPHVFSFVWWAAAVMAAHVLYRTIFRTGTALVATAVFSLSPALAIPLVWVANRNVITSVAFGSLALALYLRWRADRRPVQGVETAAAFAATALTGEYALCFIGYLIAFELCRRKESLLRRLVGALPAVGPLVVYAVARGVLGYGARASGFYRDPIANTGAYVEALPRTLSALIAASWLHVGVTSSWLEVWSVRASLLLGAGVLAVTSVWIALRQRGERDSAGESWLGCGSVLALLPVAVTEPSQRLVGVAAIGVCGFVAVLLSNGVSHGRASLRRVAWIGLAAVAASIHLAAAPVDTHNLSLDAREEMIHHLARFDTVPRDARSTGTIVVLRATDGLPVLSAPYLLREEAPKRWRVLSHTFELTRAIRLSPRSLEVTQASVPLFPIGPTGIVRTTPFAVGDVTQIAGLRATVLRVDPSGSPLAVRYDFDQDLDSSDLPWIAEGRAGFEDVVPPPVGFGVQLAP